MTIIRPLSPLRRRMLDAMPIRHDSPHTIDGSWRYVAQCAKHVRTSPDRLGPEHLRTDPLPRLPPQGSESLFSQTVGALRLFSETP
jgi:hypothetical protein